MEFFVDLSIFRIKNENIELCINFIYIITIEIEIEISMFAVKKKSITLITNVKYSRLHDTMQMWFR